MAFPMFGLCGQGWFCAVDVVLGTLAAAQVMAPGWLWAVVA